MNTGAYIYERGVFIGRVCFCDRCIAREIDEGFLLKAKETIDSGKEIYLRVESGAVKVLAFSRSFENHQQKLPV